MPAIAAASLVAQGLAFLGIGWMFHDLAGLVYVITPEMKEDPLLLTPYIGETIASYSPLIGTGILGAVASYTIYLKTEFRAPWFLTGTRVLSWLWLPLIPVGTLIGVVLLGARRAAIEEASAEPPG